MDSLGNELDSFVINLKKLLLVILCLFTFQCEQGWLEDIIDPTEPTLEGCNITSACNYSPDVNKFDDSCEYLSCLDCLGYPNGAATADSCGTCDASTLNDCTQDCAATWGGVAVTDSCGICTGGNSTTPSCELDCNGEWGGSAVVDACDICGGDGSSCKDCNGVINGTAYVDGCQICVGGNTGQTACTTEEDCAGVLGGTSYTDNCGTCDSDATNDCTQDCVGNWGGISVMDACNICGGDGTQCQDCAGTANGTATTDNCGTCDTDTSNDCSQDCDGVWGGSAVLDNCGICGGDNSDCTDCLGEVGGTATVDCAGVCGGSAVLSGCDNVCNSTAEVDCAGLCGGTMVDADSDGICDDYQGTVSDVDGNTYKTITIGTQTWMAENLKVTKYKDDTAIPTGHSDSDWSNLTIGAYAVYDDNSSNADVYGNLYNWYVVENQQVCMDGWHVPTDDEWTTLTDYLGSDWEAGGKMKETGTEHWNSPNTGATNESGFTGLPAGYRYNVNGSYHSMGIYGYFWSSSEYDSHSTIYQTLYNDNPSVSLKNSSHQSGLSIRCLEGAVDCAGVVDGSATLDNCGDCVGGDTGETACVQDCAGTWGGTATEDCSGVCNGSATTDNCGTCDSDSSNDCTQDCNGTWGGSATTDNCGTCDSDASNDCESDCDDPNTCSNCTDCEQSCCPNYCSGNYYYYNRSCSNGFCIGATSDYCSDGCTEDGCVGD